MIVTHAQLVLCFLDRMDAFHRRDDLRQRDSWASFATDDLVGVYLQGEHHQDGSIAFYEDRFTVSCTCGTTMTVAYDQLQRAQPPRTKEAADPQSRIMTITLKGGSVISMFVAGRDKKFVDAFELTRLFMNLTRIANKPPSDTPTMK